MELVTSNQQAKSGSDLKRCTVCKVVRYCNSSCQKVDWSTHKTECPCLKRVFPDVPIDSVRLMLKLVLKHQAGDYGQTFKKDIGWRNFSDFESHSNEIKSHNERMEQLSKIIFTLGKLLKEPSNLPPGDVLLEIFGKMVINSFTICDGEMQPIGVGIYLSPSLMDHSCKPNAVVTFHGTTLCVRALEDIEDACPQRIRISYVDQLGTATERKKQLLEQYYFECDCPSCHDNNLDREMLSVRCQNNRCQGYHKTSTGGTFSMCELCGHPGDDIKKQEVDRFYEACCECLEKMKEVEKKDPGEVIQLCNKCQQEQKKYFTDHNVHCVRLLVKAFDAGIDSSQWQVALKFGCRVVDSYRKFYPPNTALMGIELMKVGKIQLYLQQCSQALVSLQQAESILSITHGKKHPLYNQLTELIQQCLEMRVNMEFAVQQ